ncbi:MAG: PQQ-binding-like beta-propeller repeat protein [Bacillota bacterium]
MRGRVGLLVAAIAGVLGAQGASVRAEDWPQWGRDGSKNAVSPEKGLVSSFEPGKFKADGEEIDPATTKNIKWIARLGSAAYGNPTVAGGRVFVGTNNEPAKDPKYQGDYGIVQCLEEGSGKLLWQLAVPKLAAGKNCDYEQVGICSSPAVDGDRVYLVTSRCEVICLDVNGLANGNDGPFKEEGQYVAGPGKPPIEVGPKDADILWRFDMRDELGAFPHQMTASSVLVAGDRLYVTTSNGRDWTRKHIPSPDAPALICLDRRTGQLLGQERSGISRRAFLSNWSSPALGKVNGQDLIIFGGGDGICYGFDPVPVKGADGIGVLKEIWRYDCNPPQRRVRDGKPSKYGDPKGPNEIIATPVFHNGRVYVATGQNPEQGDGAGCLSCIDPAKVGDITTGGKIWADEEMPRSLSNVAIADGLLYHVDYAGIVRCYDAENGKLYWQHDTETRVWGSPLVADGKVYLGGESGAFVILAAGKEKRVIGQMTFESPIFSSAIVANGVLYVATEKHLYAIQEGGKR